MTVTDRETFTLGELDLNDGTTFDIESLTFTPAAKQFQFVGNPDADGEALVSEAHYTNAYLEAELRVVLSKTMAEALEALGTLTDAMQVCEQTDGGQELIWIPNQTESEYTAYALAAEFTELPITPTGELAGWFADSPVVKVKFTCKPFLYKDERSVLSVTESGAEPQQVSYVKEIDGDVPAEGRLVLRDKAPHDRRYAEWGADVVDSEEGNPSLLLRAITELSIEGYGATEASLTGSWSTKVGKSLLTPIPLILCATASLAYIGSYRVKLRCQVDGEGALFHVSYRTGKGSWVTTLPWAGPVTVLGQWMEVDLGEIVFEEADRGTQVAELRIEGQVQTTNCNAYIDFVGLTPTHRYGVARAPGQIEAPVSFLIRDEFNQTAGNLNEKLIASAGAISGPKSPGSIVNDVSYPGQPWNNPGSAGTSDAFWATVGLSIYGEVSNYLKATTFGFAIPETATIDGIEVAIQKHRTGKYITEGVRDASVRLVKAGAVVGSDYARAPLWHYELPDTFPTYGGPSDLWGTTWTPAQINAANFGVSLAAKYYWYLEGPAPQEGWVNAFTITVYYTTASGEKWATSGDAVDIAVEATGHTAQRTEVSDAAIDTGGRFAIAGATSMAATAVGLYVTRTQPAVGAGQKVRGGVLARYKDAENWLFAGFETNAEASPVRDYVVLTRRLKGAVTELGRASIPLSLEVLGTVWLAVDAAGRIFVWREISGTPELVLMREDSNFAAGKELPSGKVGFYDAKIGANASTRHYDVFAAWVPTIPVICEEGAGLEIRSDNTERTDESVWSWIPQYRGAHFFLDPGRINRLLVKLRRNDNWYEPDVTVTDKQTLEILARERYLIPR